MAQFRPVLFIIGLLLSILSLGMLFPAIVDYINGNQDWSIFIISACITGFFSIALILTNRGSIDHLTMKQAFALTGWSWVFMAIFSALPFSFSNINDISYTDAFFEAMSGLTTTGATIFTNLDDTGHGILLWRALLQWFGGIGIIVMAIAILPLLNIGGMQLFHLESSDTSEKFLPQSAAIAAAIAKLYLGISVLCCFAYWCAGMNLFESITHAMTTISTGGFSTSDNSFRYFNSAYIDWIAILFMILSSLPFVAYLKALQGRNQSLDYRLHTFLKDTQISCFLILLFSFITIVLLYRLLTVDIAPLQALRETTFNLTSVMTGTGYVTTNYSLWGTFPIIIIFAMMLIGGCAGSTSCGFKIFRLQVMFKTIRQEIYRITHPHSIATTHYNHRPLSQNIIISVITFAAIYILCFFLVAFLLHTVGLDYLTALSSSAAAIANVGPGLGEIVGPSGNYANLIDEAKWILCFAMLLGRLELFAILVMFMPSFWRR